MQLSELYIYPIKSFAGFSTQSAVLDQFGLSGDRRWMLVDELGQFITQRETPSLALIHTEYRNTGITLRYNDQVMEINQPSSSNSLVRVTIWGTSVPALDAGDGVAQWLSEQLNAKLRLVFMPNDGQRTTTIGSLDIPRPINFADSSPLLLISQASLDDLNSRLPSPVPMNRFRPNLVVSGCTPFAEDKWKKIRIGNTKFEVAEACDRCAIPSIIQETGERDKTINRILASFRRKDKKIYFGQHLVNLALGELKQGDTVEIIA